MRYDKRDGNRGKLGKQEDEDVTGREIRVPDDALTILNRLKEHGYRAYVVGGCVRDSLLGLAPKDWDICTSARPEEMQAIFRDFHVVETGLKHGTLTVVLHHVPYEVTTFRTDGLYTDHRHPDAVTFVREVEADLSRRDFTVNAMAFCPEEGVIDLFGGVEDIGRRLIRCVGDPEERFGEDALRILRALRFASVYGFDVEERTGEAARRMAEDLKLVAPERIRAELAKLLCGQAAERVLRTYPDVIGTVLPEILPGIGFDQRTPYHRYDVWEHTLRTLTAVPPVEVLRWTMLLHDAGKPAAFTLDDKGVGHAYGHQRISAEMAENAFDRLRMDRATRDRAVLLILHHDIAMSPEPPVLLRLLNRLGEEAVRQLIEVQRADRMGKGTAAAGDAEAWAAGIREALDRILAEQTCFRLDQLAVNGRDLAAAGMKPGREMGVVLQSLLEAVMAGEVPNRREALLHRAGLTAGRTGQE